MMPYTFQLGCLKVTVKNLKRRSSGLYYFRRGIPEDLRELYNGQREINCSLKTYNENEAIAACQKLTTIYTEEFKQLRSSTRRAERDKSLRLLKSWELEPVPIKDIYSNGDLDNDGHPYNQFKQYLAAKHDIGGSYKDPEPHERIAIDILHGKEKVSLEDIRDNAKAGIENKKRLHEIERCFNYFIKELPSTQLDTIRRVKIQGIVNKLLTTLSTLTVKKALGLVRKEVRESMLTHELSYANPFESVKINDVGRDSKQKEVFTKQQLLALKDFVSSGTDRETIRVVGLLMNTGARCSEIAGLRLEDINLKDSIPHLRIKEISSRGLKTKSSERLVPLVGTSLVVAKIIKEKSTKGQKYAFPNWNKNDVCKGTSCSNAVNKAIKTRFPNHTTHCFRHTMTDRLKDSGASGDIIDVILGWSGGEMRKHYGQTKMLERSRKALDLVMKSEGNKY